MNNSLSSELNAPLRAGSKGNVLNWVNILSLDAPIVAVVWQGFLAGLFEVQISLASRFVLGLTVWLAYVADRWLDGHKLPAGSAVTLRHQFAQTRARQIAIAWVMVLVGDLLLALIGLTQREFLFGLGVGLIAIAYLLSVHIQPFRKLVGAMKELFVAVVFGLGVGVFVLASFRDSADGFWACLVCFATLCLLNCLMVSSWERPDDVRQAQSSMAIRWKISPVMLRRATLVLALVFAGLAVLRFRTPVGWATTAALISCVMLVVLDALSGRIELNRRRVLADAALLSPLLIWLPMTNEL